MTNLQCIVFKLLCSCPHKFNRIPCPTKHSALETRNSHIQYVQENRYLRFATRMSNTLNYDCRGRNYFLNFQNFDWQPLIQDVWANGDHYGNRDQHVKNKFRWCSCTDCMIADLNLFNCEIPRRYFQNI